MAVGRLPQAALRWDRSETNRLVWAFGISLLLHLLVFGTYRVGRQLHWWEQWRWPAWVQSIKLISEILKTHQQPPRPAPVEPPLMFVDVNPAVATTEVPKETPYYSDKNSIAANPDASKDTDVPKIDGKQKEVVHTEDVPRTKTFPLQPTPPPAEPAKEEQKPEQAKVEPPKLEQTKTDPDPPKTESIKGDLALAKPTPPVPSAPPKDPGDAPRERPRTIKEALARQPNNRLAGEKMMQDGGVKRHAFETSLDVRNSPFGAYDAAIIAAVQNRWYSLLDDRNFIRDRTGKVTVKFHLNSDGSVTQLSFIQNTVDLALGLVCQSAIKDPAPFAPWPGDMKRLIGAEYREVTFTFYYN